MRVLRSQREAFGETIKQRIAGLNYVSLERPSYYLSNDDRARFVCEFSLRHPSERSYRGTQFRLMLNKQGELTITHYSIIAVVSSIEELLSFIAACQERLERQHAQKSKRKKVRHLKTQAIIARVKKLAQEDKFDFFTETDTVKLKLYVKLSQEEFVEVHIPFNKFQAVLPQLRTTIQSLKELHGLGIKFKLNSTRHRSIRWITHDSLAKRKK